MKEKNGHRLRINEKPLAGGSAGQFEHDAMCSTSRDSGRQAHKSQEADT